MKGAHCTTLHTNTQHVRRLEAIYYYTSIGDQPERPAGQQSAYSVRTVFKSTRSRILIVSLNSFAITLVIYSIFKQPLQIIM